MEAAYDRCGGRTEAVGARGRACGAEAHSRSSRPPKLVGAFGR